MSTTRDGGGRLRHTAGSPASSGGKFAADPAPTAAQQLAAETPLPNWIVESTAGKRMWVADDRDHAIEQHHDAFPDEAILSATEKPAQYALDQTMRLESDDAQLVEHVEHVTAALPDASVVYDGEAALVLLDQDDATTYAIWVGPGGNTESAMLATVDAYDDLLVAVEEAEWETGYEL